MQLTPSSPTASPRSSHASPLLYQALSVTRSLRDDRLHDRKLENDLRRSSGSVSGSPTNVSPSAASRLLDEVLAKAHQVRTLQERELSTVSALTPGRGSAAVDSLLTSMAKERDNAKSDFSSANETSHRLRLDLSEVSHKLASSIGEVERYKSELRSRDATLQQKLNELRAREHDDILLRAEVATQKDEANKLREETHVLKRTTRELMEELERSKKKVTELMLNKDVDEARAKEWRDRVDAGQKESSSLRESLVLITKDCEMLRKQETKRQVHMEHIEHEIETARLMLLSEQKERSDTETALQELIEEAQELRMSTSILKTKGATDIEMARQQVDELKEQVSLAVRAAEETRHSLANEVASREDAEKAYATLFQMRESEEEQRKKDKERMEVVEEEARELRGKMLMMESLRLKVTELENDKLDATSLLQNSQNFLLKNKEEQEAKLISEEQRWTHRFASAENEIVRLEDEVRSTKNLLISENKRTSAVSDNARKQRIELIRVQEENTRLTMQLKTSHTVIENFKVKMTTLHDAGRKALETAKKEVKKNQLKTQEVEKMKHQLKELRKKNQQLELIEQEKDDLVQHLRKSMTSVKMLEHEIIEIGTHGKNTNMSLVRELDEMRKSFHDFLQLSKEQVGDIKRSSSSIGFEKGSSSSW